MITMDRWQVEKKVILYFQGFFERKEGGLYDRQRKIGFMLTYEYLKKKHL